MKTIDSLTIDGEKNWKPQMLNISLHLGVHMIFRLTFLQGDWKPPCDESPSPLPIGPPIILLCPRPISLCEIWSYRNFWISRANGLQVSVSLTAINELAIGCLPDRPSFLLGGARLFSVLGHVQTCLLGKLPYSLSFQILTGNDSNGSMPKCRVAFILSPSVSLPVSPLATTCQGHIYHSGTSTWRQPTYTYGTWKLMVGSDDFPSQSGGFFVS